MAQHPLSTHPEPRVSSATHSRAVCVLRGTVAATAAHPAAPRAQRAGTATPSVTVSLPPRPSPPISPRPPRHADEDTSADLNPIYEKKHEALLLFGRGLRGGIDRHTYLP